MRDEAPPLTIPDSAGTLTASYGSRLLTTEELAVLLGGDVRPRTLVDWRHKGTGPPFVALSAKMVRYRPEAVDRWLDSLERKNEPAEAA